MGNRQWAIRKRNISSIACCLLSIAFFCGGCVAPQVIAPKATSRSALEQELISKALRQSLGGTPNKKIPFEILGKERKQVAVYVSCISGSGESGGVSEDARFVQSIIVEKLVESGAVVASGGSEEAALQVVVETLGTDVRVRYFPHAYLPLFYYITYRATASVTLYAYDAKGKEPSMLLSYRGRGEESATEWSVLGLGPFK